MPTPATVWTSPSASRWLRATLIGGLVLTLVVWAIGYAVR